MRQVVLHFLPGYYWDGATLKSTGAAMSPSQHVSTKNGEIIYYVKPVGWACSCYIRHQGLVNYINRLGE
jgi:hypothetical protein